MVFIILFVLIFPLVVGIVVLVLGPVFHVVRGSVVLLLSWGEEGGGDFKEGERVARGFCGRRGDGAGAGGEFCGGEWVG